MRGAVQNFHIGSNITNCEGKRFSPRPGIEPGPSTWQAEILTTRLSRIDEEGLGVALPGSNSWAPSPPPFFFWQKASQNLYTRFVQTWKKKKKEKKKSYSFEPDLNQRPMDICLKLPTTVHRSTNWAIEGTSALSEKFPTWIFPWPLSCFRTSLLFL